MSVRDVVEMIADYARRVHDTSRPDDEKAGRVFGYGRGMLDMAEACGCANCAAVAESLQSGRVHD